MEHVIALHQVYGELIFRGLKFHEIRKAPIVREGDVVFLYIARGNPVVLKRTLKKLGLSEEQALTQRGSIAGGFEVGEVIRADFENLWEITKDTSGLTFVYGEEVGKTWLRSYIKDQGYAFTIEKPFLFQEPLTREKMKEVYGTRVDGVIHLSSRTRKPWVRALLEDLMSRDMRFI
ncbi:ASCH domain-containing protein [Thermococcus sibiricus]|uniref:ASCH domain-containing protein n=2 Tax=Thermococcus sibiricus TaxID=172049 RepID=C6A4I4_THESM|nr:ASCH domain-containing protein [Thermococcus sibiricus]ACS90529.1 hypothetical protein TSIB_1478 [Thermococcus sibiricus MM 739]KUK16973.1 MAG: Uncharacterized protein XD54_1732 [Thermococcus sibiricus]KUK27950.1 MAG: Uncharacterized protein XD61_1510 [Thermococcus sp. 40_45]